MKKTYSRNHMLYDLAIVFFILSLLGWCAETLYFLLRWHCLEDRGFLTLPFCTIYGSAVLLVYGLLGTPRGGRLSALFSRAAQLNAFSKIPATLALFGLYFLLASIPPALVELVVGIAFSDGLGLTLWDYGYHSFQLFGSICLSQTLLWGALLTLGMSTVWDPLLALVQAIPLSAKKTAAIALSLGLAIDFCINLLCLLSYGHTVALF